MTTTGMYCRHCGRPATVRRHWTAHNNVVGTGRIYGYCDVHAAEHDKREAAALDAKRGS